MNCNAAPATFEMYRQLIESMEDYAVFLMDCQGRVMSWNPGAQRLLGYRQEEILGRDFAVFFTPEDLRSGARDHELQMAAATGRASDDRWHVRKDGSRFFGSGITTSVRNDQGEIAGFAKVLRDFTERKRLEEELRSRAEALARADREKDEFLAVLAHELRNPLAPIFYALQLLSQDADANAHRQARSIVERQVRRLARLIDDLLDASRIATGKLELRKGRVEVNRLVQHAVETAQPFLTTRRHQLTLTLPGEEIWLEADPSRLEQVLTNLLHNAAKFTDEGGHISLLVEPRAGEVVLRVRDTGMGIPPEVLPRIFEPFIQGNRTNDPSQGGLGIGLTLARRLVELHGGTLLATSDGAGQGSEFAVTLPLPAALATAPHPETTPVPAHEVRHQPLRVLVVDDNEDTVEMLAALLAMDGHEVRMAYSGPDALAAAATFRPDAMVLDLGLPGFDGYEVARRLRQDSADRDMVLIAASGYGQEDDLQRSREAGFDHHLIKPVEPRRLREILATVGRGPERS
jgi:PAS domain S-box-containing protein